MQTWKSKYLSDKLFVPVMTVVGSQDTNIWVIILINFVSFFNSTLFLLFMSWENFKVLGCLW